MSGIQLTQNFGLSLLFPNQAQKDVVINTDLTQIDSLLQLNVQNIQNAPPVSPTDQIKYIVGTAPSGMWSGNPNAIAIFQSNGNFWQFYQPKSGWVAFDVATNSLYYWSGTAWNIMVTFANTNLLALAALTPSLNTMIFGTGTTWSEGTFLSVLGPTIQPFAAMYALIFGG